jgi:large subunit ribosomal protein L3
MAKHNKPIAGSRAYWPKKRAKRIYPRAKVVPEIGIKDVMPLVFAGYKAGMTSVIYTDTKRGSVTHGQDVLKSATILDCPPLMVCGIKTYRMASGVLEDNGLVWSEKPGKDTTRKTKLPKNPKTKEKSAEIERDLDKICDVRLLACTHPRESGLGKKKPELFEISLSGDVKGKWKYALERLGKEIKISEVFSHGEYVDVRSVTKGKGYQGPVKRFGIKVRSRKNKGKMRHVGTLGAKNVARIFPGKLAMAGQLGFQTRTEYNKRVLKIGSGDVNPKGGFVNYGLVPKDYVMIEGSVPGPRKRLIMLRKSSNVNRKNPVEIKHISLESQQ